MSLYKRTDSPRWWVKISHGGRTIQRSTGTEDKAQAQEYHDKLKVSLWEQQRLGDQAASRMEGSGRTLACRNLGKGHAPPRHREASLAGFVPGHADARRNYAGRHRPRQGRATEDGEQVYGQSLPGSGQSHSASGTGRMGVDRQGAEGKAVQGRPGTGTVDYRGAGGNAARRVAGASAGRRALRVGYGAAALECGRTGMVARQPGRRSCLGRARLNRRIAGRLPCRSMRPRWRSCGDSSASIRRECLRTLESRWRGPAHELGRRRWNAPASRTSAGTT